MAKPLTKSRPRPRKAEGKAGKIQSLPELARLLQAARRKGSRIAHCHGVFDLVHPGHIVHFKEARRHGDILVVTVTPDRFVNKGPGRPVFNQQLRLETLAALELVDYVALNEWPTATETIRLLRPHAYVKGSDYADPSADLTGKITEEEEAVRSVGGELVFTDGFRSSSSHLINRFFNLYPRGTQEYLDAFRRRYPADEVIGHLQSLSDLKALVVGEAILDQYCYCVPLGKSTKDTIVATKYLSEENFAGGAAATANHLAGVCKEVTLLTTLGPDESEEEFIRGKLRSNVRLEVVRTPNRPTVRKRRFLEPVNMSKMFEVQFLDDTPLGGDLEKRLESRLQSRLEGHDLVLVNDFGHGMLTERLRGALSRCGKYLALNTQSNSANHGYNPVTNYPRADFVALDDPELRLAARSRYGDLQAMVTKVKEQLQVKTFLVSLGASGTVSLSPEGWHAAPALAIRIVDRTGAGDALFAITSPCAYRGVPADVLGFIGNCVGALAVEIVCNRDPVEPVTLYKFISTLLK